MTGSQAKASQPRETRSADPTLSPILGDGMSGATLIAEGTELECKLKARENIRLDGRLLGDLQCEGRVVMGPKSFLRGTLHAREAVVMGRVEGKIQVEEALHLRETASVQGPIAARYLTVDEGAEFVGECSIGEGQAPA
ncbi:MAG: polymer-forming cytoskeletal protein [Bacteroidetes bacterium]|nr:MAG: polymer-forming cytoskeletal protein [Bacteroidota bacterium]